MRVPSVLSRNLLAYIQGGGKESVKAEVMLNAMGWLRDGTRAPMNVVLTARQIWQAKDAKQLGVDFGNSSDLSGTSNSGDKEIPF